MKDLYILRHAKSSREYEELTDFERPLNHRGRMDAPLMGTYMKKKGIKPDLILSSPANRALMTARLLADAIGYPLSCIMVEEAVYEAWREDLVNLLSRLKESHNTVILVGHNPGLQLLANYLAEFPHDNLPTCGLVYMRLNVKHWNDIREHCGRLLSFDYPKKIEKTF